VTEAGTAAGRRRSFGRAVVATYSTNLLVASLSLVNVLITSRVLGAAGRGEIVFLTTVAMLTSTLSSLGVEEATANIAGREPERRRALGANTVLLAFAFGVLAIAVLTGLIALFPSVAGGSDPTLRWLALASIPMLILLFYLQFLVRADYGFAAANAAALAGPVLNVLVNSVLAVVGVLTVGTAIVTWIVGQAVSTAVLAWYTHTRLSGFGRPDARLAQRSVGFGLKAHTGRVMKAGNYRLDQWILGAIAGPRELGLYSIAVAWSEALFYLPEALAMVLRPDVVRADPQGAGRQSAVVFRAAVILTIPLGLALVVAAPFLCVTLLGDEFEGAIAPLRILVPGAFGIIALKLLANVLTAQGKPMLGNAAIAVAFAATIALDLVLIPPYGGIGAAIASTLSYTAGGLAVAVIFARTLETPLRDLIPRRSDFRRFSATLSPVVLRRKRPSAS
jgi:O-antigen/teichoic acid export membrane protein